MQVYSYDPITGVYLGQEPAFPSPLEPGVYLIPEHATSIVPPTPSANQQAIFSNGAWTLASIPAPIPPAPNANYDWNGTAWVYNLTRGQAAQIALIDAQYNIHMNAGFVSSALGSPHTYPSNIAQLGGRTTESHVHKLVSQWSASTAAIVGSWIAGNPGQLFQCVTAGTTGTVAPAWPTTLGTTVVDGTVTWKLYDEWGGNFVCVDPTGKTINAAHTQDQLWQVGLDAKQNVDAIIAHYLTLINQVNAATTEAAVLGVPTW